MKNFFLIMVSIFLFAFDAHANNDVLTNTICNIVVYIQKLGGPIFTVAIIGTSLLVIFAKIQWPTLFAFGMFTAVFFGAHGIVKAIIPNTIEVCCPTGQVWIKGINGAPGMCR